MHTKEPWDIGTNSESYKSYECYIGNADVIGAVAFIPKSQNKNGKANARRIVACVNACAGMDDPEAHITLLEDNANDAGKYKHQRDELLSIVKDMRNAKSEVFSMSPEGRKYLAKMDAAIAKCEAS